MTDDETLQRLYRSQCHLPPEAALGDSLTELREQLYALGEHTPRGTFRSPTPEVSPNAIESTYPPVLGRYHLRERLGAGGSGVVYLAEDVQLHRPVALKLPRLPALADPEGRGRFLREAKAAAGLHHPNIVAVYDAGECDGLCYLASAYCPGDTLAQWLQDRTAPAAPDEAAQVVLALADAVQHAHENGVLHRDIKPQNVLLDPTSRFQNLPFSPKLTDFSIAKLADGEGTETATDVLLGTPRYMAPELAAGRRDQLGPACDIYALGVMLYELRSNVNLESALTEAERAKARAEQSDDQTQQLLYNADMRLAARAWKDGDLRVLTDLLRRHVPREGQPDRRGLEWRYLWNLADVTPRTLAAHPQDIYFVCTSPDGRRLASAGKDAVVRLYDLATGTLLKSIETGQGEVNGLAFSPDGRRIASAGDDGTVRIWNVADASQMLKIAAHPGIAFQVAFTPDGTTLATCGNDPIIRLWDAATGSELGSLVRHKGSVEAITLSSDGRLLASAGADGFVKIWHLAERREVAGLTMQNPIASFSGVAFSPDGQLVVAASLNRSVYVVSAPTGQRLAEGFHHDRVHSIAVFPDGYYVVSGDAGGVISVWDLERYRAAPQTDDQWAEMQCVNRWRAHEGRVYALLALPDGQLISAGADGKIRVWHLRTARNAVAANLDMKLLRPLFLPDQRLLAISDWEILAFDLSKDQPLERAAVKPFAGTFRTMSTNGSSIAALSEQGNAKIWNAASVLMGEVTGVQEAREISLSPDGTLLATLSGPPQRCVRIFEVTTGSLVTSYGIPGGSVSRLTFSPDGQQIALGIDNDLLLWDYLEDRPRRFPSTHAHFTTLVYRHDGSLLATAGSDRVIKLWDPKTGDALGTLTGHRGSVAALAFSPDGRSLLSAGEDGTLKVWSVNGREELFDLYQHAGAGLQDMCISAEGRWVACTVMHDGQLLLLDLGEPPKPPTPVGGVLRP